MYIATGNGYSKPPAIEACEAARLNETNPPIPDPCLVPDDHSESILAINIDSGNIAWAKHLGGYDTWTLVCQTSPVKKPNCLSAVGPDYDFGEAPFLLTIKGEEHGSWRDVVIAGQKSGIVHTLDRATGEIVWQTVSWNLRHKLPRHCLNLISGRLFPVPQFDLPCWDHDARSLNYSMQPLNARSI